MKTFCYVYILQSTVDPDRFYAGLTDDLPARLKTHNAGRVRYTAQWKPWRIKTYIAFSDRGRAAAFERYLKSSSGRAFVKSRL
jgi:predicted GIY-YIG superfamily endonuclease